MKLRDRWRVLAGRRLERRTAGHRLLRAFAGAHPDAYFVEIGAGDGVTVDHLRPFVLSRPWRGIMVEPVPYVFERLRRTYGDLERVALENAAISDHDGTLAFHYFAEPTGDEGGQAPDHLHLLGSLSREMLERHVDAAHPGRRIVRAQLPCLTFASLCRKHRVERIDVLVIDAEGHDCAILEQIDFDTIRPRVLVYEDVHVPAAVGAESRDRLQRLGYETMQDGFDTWCVDARVDDSLTSAWRRLRQAGPTVPREDLDLWFAREPRPR